MRKSIVALKREISRAPTNERGRRKYGRELRSRIVQIALAAKQDGTPVTQIASALGIRDQVLSGWLRKAQDPGTVRTVEVVEDLPQATSQLRLRLPSGATIEGLSLDDVAKLLDWPTGPR